MVPFTLTRLGTTGPRFDYGTDDILGCINRNKDPILSNNNIIYMYYDILFVYHPFYMLSISPTFLSVVTYLLYFANVFNRYNLLLRLPSV